MQYVILNAAITVRIQLIWQLLRYTNVVVNKQKRSGFFNRAVICSVLFSAQIILIIAMPYLLVFQKLGLKFWHKGTLKVLAG